MYTYKAGNRENPVPRVPLAPLPNWAGSAASPACPTVKTTTTSEIPESPDRTGADMVKQLALPDIEERAEIAGGLNPVAFADLATPGQAGRMVFVTDGRKVSQGAGLGTGTPAYDDGTAWRRTGDDTTVEV